MSRKPIVLQLCASLKLYSLLSIIPSTKKATYESLESQEVNKLPFYWLCNRLLYWFGRLSPLKIVFLFNFDVLRPLLKLTSNSIASIIRSVKHFRGALLVFLSLHFTFYNYSIL